MQMAYSKSGGEYMQKFMGAKNLFVNLNTIKTKYFESIREEVNNSINNHQIVANQLRLLYVGVVEERKKIKELLDLLVDLNACSKDKKYQIDIVGGGNQLGKLAKTI